MQKQRRIAPWRRTFQWATSFAVLLIPFVRLEGESLLRIDLPARTLFVFGRTLRLEELYLLLLLVVGLVFVFLFLTLVFGRVWCGWACPQTSLSDLVEGFARALGVKVRRGTIAPRLWQIPILHGFYALLAALVAANLIWYFLPPYEFFPRLLRGELPPSATVALVMVGAVIYLDMAFVRRSFCRTVCPYGRFQTALVDSGTLTLRCPPQEAARCIQCEACVRTCPAGIDIREGYQVGCVECGRCLDACSTVMGLRNQPGIIAYTFGVEGKGPRALWTPRVGLVLLAAVAVCAAFVLAAATRNPIGFTVRKASAANRVLPGGETAIFFTGYLSNRGTSLATLELSAQRSDGRSLAVRGPVRGIVLPPGERRQIDFVLLVPGSLGQGTGSVLFSVTGPDRELGAEARAVLEGARRDGADG